MSDRQQPTALPRALRRLGRRIRSWTRRTPTREVVVTFVVLAVAAAAVVAIVVFLLS